ncbi:MAG: insulinase family protein [Ignavibacteriaceae bacterium]|nr:insulinase family protein [Ignavibacteriaceae bacterium]
MTMKIVIAIILFASFIIPQNFKPNDVVPFDKKIKSGQLSNGLKYFIRENSKPTNRAELRLVVNVGSILEDEDQQGLAHFVEHMAFNGTKNFQKNELVNYLESIGMKFGPDINAYTSFDETVYMLQLPTDNTETLHKGFQILEDWAHNLSFDNEEIDKERGVIIEEWRLGRGASARMRDKQFPVLFDKSQYADRLPIGKKEILENFEYETLKRFYRDWYRPDLMAVIVVGDFKIEDIEKLIIQHFSNLKMPKNVRERTFFPVPDQEKISFAIATDPEASGSSISVYYKVKSGDNGKVVDFKKRLTEVLYNRMLSSRLRELTFTSDPPFASSNSAKGQFIRTREFYFLGATVKDGGIEKGLDALLTEAERVKRFGFTESELQRTKNEQIRSIELSYTERDKSESAKYVNEYIRHYLNGEPVPGIEYEYALQKEIVPQITLEEINSLASEWMNDNNAIVMVSLPQKDNLQPPTEEGLLKVFQNVKSKKLEQYTDVVDDAPLVEKELVSASIMNEKKIDEFKVTEWQLPNGVKVILKPTDFKNDEVLLRAYSFGGNSLVDDNDFIPASTAGQLIVQSGVGKYDNPSLVKKLSGKVVNLNPYIGEHSEGFLGTSSKKDMETMFQLIYAYFVTPRIDTAAFSAYKSRMRTFVENRDVSPDAAFNDTLDLTLNNYHPRRMPWTLKTLDKLDLNKSMKIYQDRFKDASDFTFILVGSFSLDEVKPLVEKYLANLPSINRKESYRDIKIKTPTGVIKKNVYKGIEQKSYVTISFNGDFNWTREESYLISSMASAFRIKIRELIREDKGGTYGVQFSASGRQAPYNSYEVKVAFGCDPSRVDELLENLFAELKSLLSKPIDNSYVEKVKEIQRRDREVQIKQNDFWARTLQSYYYYNRNLSELNTMDELINNLSSEAILATAKKYIDFDNYVQVVLYPEK